ncbi:MAG: DNA-directed RNA polymerase subunit omega [Phycisphaerae bacterium]|nr:DNA-directed RNA polymerase subunit omega [Phycisphaerae bacterium]
MLEVLKDDDIINKVGGRFKLAALMQRRWVELLQGARPAVKREDGMTDLEVIAEEVMQEKLGIDYETSDVPSPDELH